MTIGHYKNYLNPQSNKKRWYERIHERKMYLYTTRIASIPESEIIKEKAKYSRVAVDSSVYSLVTSVPNHTLNSCKSLSKDEHVILV